ncbi:hypothetical protein [Plebeiibacterium marinum]|uniref:Uncharacterized protein n=1 Tax=Plebeiibacterium marinum TaxID=2992111 RepID=A0AAE3SJS9_9BACT|nr:hypothetical protein [Plebeiobacterium marinum]MCW3805748.1 hypothetical protein [Plebeiobacterium marinum]
MSLNTITITIFIISIIYNFYKISTIYFGKLWNKILNEKVLFNTKVELPRITLLSLISLLLYISYKDINQPLDNESTIIQLSQISQSIVFIIICIISIVIWSPRVDLILNKNVNKNIDLNIKYLKLKNEQAKKDFLNLLRYFIQDLKLFKNYSITQLKGLIDPESKTIFDIPSEKITIKTRGINYKIESKDLFYIFYTIGQRNCFVNRNTNEVLHTRFTFDGDSIKNMKKAKSRTFKYIEHNLLLKIKNDLKFYEFDLDLSKLPYVNKQK